MALIFQRLNIALHVTVALYRMSAVMEYTHLYELADPESDINKNTPVPDTTNWFSQIKDKEDLIFDAHQYLADEIEQVALSYHGNAFHYFFNMLDDVLESDGIKEINFDKLRNDVSHHNNQMMSTKSSQELNPVFGLPPVINTNYVESYLIFLATAINNFKLTINRHLKLYKEGKLLPNNIPSAIATYQLPPSTELAHIKQPKIQTDLTVEQLAALFKLLSLEKPKIFTNKTKLEFIEAISLSFATKGKEDFSEAYFNKHFYNKKVEQKIKTYWEKKLYSMLGRIKDL